MSDLIAEAAKLEGRKPQLRKVDEVHDIRELQHVQLRRRTEFEQALRRKLYDMRQWMRYARFEAHEMRDLPRARAVFERALQVTSEWVPLWLRYVDTELEAQNTARARNVLERATTQLPRIARLWLTYAALEERLGHPHAVTALFERWIEWQPGPDAWIAYLDFARRNRHSDPTDESQEAQIARRFVAAYPKDVRSWQSWARAVQSPRDVFACGVDAFDNDSDARIQLLRWWASWEDSQDEPERANALRALASAPQGGRSAAERAFEARVATDPTDYDTWWALLTESPSLETFERSVATPPATPWTPNDSFAGEMDEAPNTAWRKYAWLWLRYACFVELENSTSVESCMESARKVLERATSAVPHSAKLWRARAGAELRAGDVTAMRRIMGRALGITKHKPRVYKDYIAFETKLGSTDRVRTLWTQFCEWWPMRAEAWRGFAEFEAYIGETLRSSAILGAGTRWCSELWHDWAETEADVGAFDNARNVYAQWESSRCEAQAFIEHAMFELSLGLGEDSEQVDPAALDQARAVFGQGHASLTIDERLVLYDAEAQFEHTYGTEESLREVNARAPRLGDRGEFEFPDPVAESNELPRDSADTSLARLLANAHKWAAARASESKHT